MLLEINKYIKPSLLRDFTLEHSTALDLFSLENGRAISAANDSFIQASSSKQLIHELNAILLYERGRGSSSELEELKNISLDRSVSHKLTSLPNTGKEAYEVQALKKYFQRARENGLTAKPYIGLDTGEAAEFLITVMKNMIGSCQKVTNHGSAASGWTASLKNEYDFQNLFWITVKPWLPQLAREGVEIIYDNNKKQSDFSLFQNQLVIEMKHIKDDNDKRSIVKTLDGLKSFYLQHPNIRVLVFAIFVENNVELDDRKWEADFSYDEYTPSVKAVVIRNHDANTT